MPSLGGLRSLRALDDDPYRDEQLVELYDSDNAARDDHEYYRTLADALEANKILDFGCGTGLLTRALATPGRVVIGVDPSATMLGYARRQPGAEAVTWIDGDAAAIEGAGDVDLVVSSGNTMMHLSPEAYPSVLSSLAEALRPDGVISFESRNPAAQAWAHWTRSATYTEREIPSGHLRGEAAGARAGLVCHLRRSVAVCGRVQRGEFKRSLLRVVGCDWWTVHGLGGGDGAMAAQR